MPEQDNVSISSSRYWQAHVKAQGRSGLSRAEYCRRHDLSYHAMTYWQRKLNRSRDALPVLVQVPVRHCGCGDTRQNRNSGVTIRLNNGTAVELADEFSAATLDRALAVLGVR